MAVGQVRRNIHGQPIGPVNQADTFGGAAFSSHLLDKQINMFVNRWLHSLQRPVAEGGCELFGQSPMPYRVFFKGNATRLLAASVEVGLDECLQAMDLGPVDIVEGLLRKEDQFVGRDPHDVAWLYV